MPARPPKVPDWLFPVVALVGAALVAVGAYYAYGQQNPSPPALGAGMISANVQGIPKPPALPIPQVIAGATVTVLSSDGARTITSGTTDGNGNVLISAVPVGNYLVQASASGWITAILAVAVNVGRTTTVPFYLLQ